MSAIHQVIAEMRAQAVQLQVELDRAVYEACPGPHLPRQHRDGRPPWCTACGYTASGLRVEEIE